MRCSVQWSKYPLPFLLRRVWFPPTADSISSGERSRMTYELPRNQAERRSAARQWTPGREGQQSFTEQQSGIPLRSVPNSGEPQLPHLHSPSPRQHSSGDAVSEHTYRQLLEELRSHEHTHAQLRDRHQQLVSELSAMRQRYANALSPAPPDSSPQSDSPPPQTDTEAVAAVTPPPIALPSIRSIPPTSNRIESSSSPTAQPDFSFLSRLRQYEHKKHQQQTVRSRSSVPQAAQQHQPAPTRPSPPPQDLADPLPPAGHPQLQAFEELMQPFREDPTAEMPDFSDYESLYAKARARYRSDTTPFWIWMLVALLLLLGSFSLGFMLMQSFVRGSVPTPPTDPPAVSVQ